MSAQASAATNVVELDSARRRGPKNVAAARVISIDYRSIVENAIAGLADNTPDSRREIYVQARSIVRRHLTLMRLPEPIVELEQLSLDLTIRRIERRWRARQAAEMSIGPAREGNGRQTAFDGAVGPLTMRLRSISRALGSPIGLTVAVSIALAAIVLVFFIDNKTIYKSLIDSAPGQWLSQRDLVPFATRRGRPTATDADAAATGVGSAPSPAAVIALPARPGAGDSPPYRGATRIRPIRADLSALVPAVAPIPEEPAQAQVPGPCETYSLSSERLGCAIDEGLKAGPGPKSRARWLAGYAAINNVAAAHPILPVVTVPGAPWTTAASFAAPNASPAAVPGTPAARNANVKVAALVDGGRKWSNRGDLDRALHDFTEAIRLDPKYPDSYHERGQVMFKMGETERAIADYSAAIQRDPQFGAALRSRGMAYLYRGANDLALADLTRAIALAESDPSTLSPIELFYAHRSRAQIYSAKQQYELEVADCTAVIDAYERNPMLAEELKQNYADVGAANVIATVYRQRATAYIRQANWEAAMADLTAAIPLSYDHGFAALVDRAKIHEGLGQRDEAIADLKGALAVRPGSEEARLALRRLGVPLKPATPLNAF